MPFDILAGPDGNLWFTEQAGVKIGRITPKGKVTDFPIGGGMQPRQLTVGPDKNLWMTDQGANLVYRITPNGAAPPTITAGAALLATPRGIATGPDGDLWVANALGTVQRVKPDGTADGPAIITGGSNLQYITKGADNATVGHGLQRRPDPGRDNAAVPGHAGRHRDEQGAAGDHFGARPQALLRRGRRRPGGRADREHQDGRHRLQGDQGPRRRRQRPRGRRLRP